MKKRKLIAVLAAMVTIAVAAGCSGKEKTEAPAETNTEAEAPEEEAEAEEETETVGLSEEEEQMLYNDYIEINNMMVGRFYDAIDSYFTYVDFQEEFTPLQDDYWCSSVISTFYDDLDEADELVAKKEELSELDTAYLALSPVMRELALAIDEADVYTEEEAYLEDDYAKGKEIHAAIWNAYAQYETLSEDFLNKLSAMASDQRAQDMEQMKEEGYEATYALVSMVTTAQDIQAAIYEQGIMDDSMMLDLDIEALQSLYDQYQEEVQTVLGYLEDEETMRSEGFPTNSAYYVTFQESVEKSAEELTELFRRVSEGEGPSDFDISNQFIVSGTISGFDTKVSAMINDYNRMLGY